MSKPHGTIHRKFTDEEVRQIEVMGGLGMPMDQIAAVFDISKDTLEDRVKDDPRIKAAIKRGRAKASSKVRQTAFQMAVSGESPAMTIFWLKVRERWREQDDAKTIGDAPIAMAYDPTRKIPKPVKQITPAAPAAPVIGVIADGKGRKNDESD